jgi:hypothetical protein
VVDRLFPTTYPDVTYLGGRQTAPGEWRWVTGPDGKADTGKGTLFWRGDEQGAAEGGHYANWMSSAFQHDGKWGVSHVCCVTLFPTACRNSPAPWATAMPTSMPPAISWSSAAISL